MATEQQVLKDLTAGQRGVFNKLNKQVCFFNGYDKPRYFDQNGRSGYLGLEAWIAAGYTITGAASAGGSLTASRFFSCVAVPIDTNYANVNGDYRMGNPTTASTAVQTTAANKTITWTLPLAHPQVSLNTYAPALLTGGNAATAVIGSWNAVADGTFRITINGTVRDITGLDFTGDADMAAVAATIQAGIRAVTSKYEACTWSTNHFVITSSDTTSTSAFTVASAQGTGTDVSGAGGTNFMDSDVGNGVVTNAVLSAEADEVYLYCSQACSTAATAEAAQKYYIGSVSNVAGETLAMTTDPTTAVDAVQNDNFQPPTIRMAEVLAGKVFGIVGVIESRGKIQWDSANARFQGETFGAYNISAIADQGNDIWRYSFSGTPDLSSISMGDRVSTTGCTNSANDMTLAVIVGISDASDYMEIRNADGVAQAGAGGTATAYTTYIGDGMSGGTFQFEDDGVAQRYTIDVVTRDSQYFTVTATEYNGIIDADTLTNFTITTHDRKLWYSKIDEPNSWPSLNMIQFDEDLVAVSTAGENLAVYSLSGVYILNPRNPVEYRRTHSPVGTPAPFSCIPTDNGVYFYDGVLFRLFDGYNSTEFTSRRVRQLLNQVNPAAKHLVHGSFLATEDSIRWFMPIGTNQPTNNYWVQYNINTGFWWYGRCMDATCSTVIEELTTGESILYTGTSARYSKVGFVNKWDKDSTVDGQNAATTNIFATVSSVIDPDNQITIDIGATETLSSNDIGTPFQVVDSVGTRDISAIIETITDNGGGNYTLTYHDDFDLSTVVAGDWVILGVPAFSYGIKWMDFQTPQYLHELKEVQVHATPGAYTWGLIDFYTDYSATPNKTVAWDLAADETKQVIRYHGARGNQIGFRIRAWSAGAFEIRDIVVIHKTLV